MSKNVLAFDFGASSGRAILGSFDGEKISLKEVHRFENDPVTINSTVYWDVLRLFYEIKTGIIKARDAGGFSSIGIDTWGVDFGLFDKAGKLTENPVHYRDARTVGMLDEAFKTMPREELYNITGIQFMEINSLFQLLSLKKQRPETFERADKLLFMPDLFSYFLTGNMYSEYSIASTSQLLDAKKRNWSEELLDKFNIKKSLLCKIIPPGTVFGNLCDEICSDCGVESVPVIAVCGHDTQSAITSVPCPEGDFAFISSGTWSLFGTELKEPIINKTTMDINITNEGGYGNSTGFLKNIIGLWLIQESRRYWSRHGKSFTFAELEKAARSCEPFKCFIDPDAPEFSTYGNIPQRISDYCSKTGQFVPETPGEIIRCIYDSLAMKYKLTFEKLCKCTEKDYPVIHVIGGGTKDSFLCQLTANACSKPVIAGPVEATAMGNIAVQLLASGEFSNISEARKVISKSEDIKTYTPADCEKWNDAYETFIKIIQA